MTRWNKLAYRSLLLISFIGVNALILMGLGAILGHLNTGAERASILHLGVSLEQVYMPSTSWGNLDNEGRRMEEQTLHDIEEDFLRAWYVRSVAFKNNDPYGLDDYYTTNMRNKLKSLIEANIASNTTISSTALDHKLHLDFYSADGKLVSFTDSLVTAKHEVFKGGELVHQYQDKTTYRVIMLLEDGFWRIRHLLSLDHKLIPKKTKGIAVKVPEISKIKGVNYYPRSQPWQLFNVEMNLQEITGDFKFLKSEGVNTLRIFVSYPVFGKAYIDPNKLTRLVSFMDLANEYDLEVLITLFDFYGNYDLTDWTLTHRHAEAIIKSLRDHPALLGWDIKNEPDLDFKNRGEERVIGWLNEMIDQVKTWDPDHPVTIGWSNAEDARILIEKVDFISFHYYKDPEDFQEACSNLKKYSEGKEILLEEFGYSSYSGIANLWSGSEGKQASYYQEMEKFISESEIPFLSWTLHDFEEVPNEVIGRLPWRKSRQKKFGLLRPDGSKKAAFDLLYKE